jgi:hypothetical protein
MRFICNIRNTGHEDLRHRKTAAVEFVGYLVKSGVCVEVELQPPNLLESYILSVFLSVTLASKYFRTLSETSNSLTYILPNDDRLLFSDQDCTTVIH